MFAGTSAASGLSLTRCEKSETRHGQDCNGIETGPTALATTRMCTLCSCCTLRDLYFGV